MGVLEIIVGALLLASQFVPQLAIVAPWFWSAVLEVVLVIAVIVRGRGRSWVITVLALQHQIAPPTLRLESTGADCTLDYIPHTPRPLAMSRALSNTFGFGGSNVSLLFELVL